MQESRIWLLLAKKNSGDATLQELTELNGLLLQDKFLLHSIDLIEKALEVPIVVNGIDEQHTMNVWDKIIDRTSIEQNELPEPIIPISKLRVLWIKIAGVAALLAVMVAGYFWAPDKNDALVGNQNIVSTKYGSKTKIQLPDGTTVMLNGGSTLTYDDSFNKKIREIALTGEAYFDVTHDKTKPFIIHTKAIDVRVLGTSFNVKAYPEDKTTEASLIKGSIEVSFINRSNGKILLKPNEKIVVANDYKIFQKQKEQTQPQKADKLTVPIISITSINFEPNRKDSITKETGWVKNTLVFKSETFEDLAKRLERWYNVKIEFKNDILKQLKFTGTLDDEPIKEVMMYLSAVATFHFVINKEQIVISK